MRYEEQLIFFCTGNKLKGPQREQRPKEEHAKPVEGEGAGEEEERAVDDETSMLAGLTGLPLTEDVLLFAGLWKIPS